MFYQIFLSPQVKGWAIITYKNDITSWPRVSKGLKTCDHRKLGNIKKVSKLLQMIA